MSPKCWNCDFVRSLMVDFSRAFDRVDHTLLLKLDGLNFSPNAMNWIISFLTNRTQVVKVIDHLSLSTAYQYHCIYQYYSVRWCWPNGCYCGKSFANYLIL